MPFARKINNVIIADDDSDDQMLVREVIEDYEFPVNTIVLSDGLQLMHSLKSGILPDLVLLDLNMPYKNGIECLTEIRADESTRSLPVVILSTSKAIRDMELCFNAQAHLFLSKPSTFDGLKKMIHTVLAIDWNRLPLTLNKQQFMKIALGAPIGSIFEEA